MTQTFSCSYIDYVYSLTSAIYCKISFIRTSSLVGGAREPKGKSDSGCCASEAVVHRAHFVIRPRVVHLQLLFTELNLFVFYNVFINAKHREKTLVNVIKHLSSVAQKYSLIISQNI